MKPETIYAILFSILDDEKITQKEQLLFMKWLEASKENQDEYEQLKSLYPHLTRTAKEKEYDVEQAWQKTASRTIYKKRMFRLPAWSRYVAILAFTASIIGISLLVKDPVASISHINMAEFEQPTLLLENGEKILLSEEIFAREEKYVIITNDAKNQLVYKTKETSQELISPNNHLVIPKGKTYQLVLSDGTKIWLNSESSLIYPTRFVEEKREVSLLGEALFEVAKDSERPFIVKANGIEIDVLGTRFNVSCYTNDPIVSTTLLEGSVKIRPAIGENQVIAPSEQFTYNRKNSETDIRIVDTELYTSWINGYYIFKDARLEDIIHKIQRWYDISIDYEDHSLKEGRYSISIEKHTDIDKVLEVLSYTSDVKLERVNHIIHVTKRKELPMK